MSRIPFTVYDFLAYLSAGFIVLAAGDYAFDQGWLLRDDLGLVAGVFWAVAAYVTGHVMANLAGWVLETKILRDWLRSPEETLFGSRSPSSRRRRLFPGFYRPLPGETHTRVLGKARSKGISSSELASPDRGLFFHCFAVVKRDPITRERLDTFLNLYGFCRNACFALLVATLVLLIGVGSSPWRDSGTGDDVWWAIAAAPVAAVGLFYRYLKFFREYTIEVFRTYAEVE